VSREVPVQQRGDLHAFQVCQQERHVIEAFVLESLKDLVYHAPSLLAPPILKEGKRRANGKK
jgi:hypothetical protein